MIEYTLNYFIWLYWFLLKDLTVYTYQQFIYFLILTRTLPMILNIYKPLYGDFTPQGVLIGIFIRFWWAFFGLIISIILIIPYFIFWLVVVLLPWLPLIQVVNYVY